MKNILLITILLFCTSAYSQNIVTYKNIIPKELKKYVPGSTLEKNEKKLSDYENTSGSMSFRKEYSIKNPAKGIKEVTLYFDSEDPQQLYEYIINYSDVSKRDEFISKIYGTPNDEDEWRWKMEDGHTAKAWKFMSKLVVAIAYPNTEWAKEW